MIGKIKANPYNNSVLNLPNIGSPIFCFTKNECVLKENEIWLEGALLKISSYPLLFKEYGYDYTPEDADEPPEGYFYLQDWRNRAPWGSPDGTLGYLDATAPNIKGRYYYIFGKTTPVIQEGCLNYVYDPYTYSGFNAGSAVTQGGLLMNAHNSNPIYQDDATVRPPSIKCRVKTRYR